MLALRKLKTLAARVIFLTCLSVLVILCCWSYYQQWLGDSRVLVKHHIPNYGTDQIIKEYNRKQSSSNGELVQRITNTLETKTNVATSVLVDNGTPSLLTHTPHSSVKESIANDMRQCSLVLGISARGVETYQQTINEIANKGDIFLNALWEVIPQKFNSDLKNPCWHSKLTVPQKIVNELPYMIDQGFNYLKRRDIKMIFGQLFNYSQSSDREVNETLFCLPYFMLAGFAKCGTTSLHSVLSHHSHIAPPEVKEPHWWTRTPLKDMGYEYLKIVVVRYLLNFMSASKTIASKSTVGDPVITYDGSSSILPDSIFKVKEIDFCALPAVMHRVNPNMKLVVIIRDPVSRAYSQFYYMHGPLDTWPSEMRKDAPSYFHRYTLQAVKEFNKCIKSNRSDYECVHSTTTGRKELNTWVGLGVYYIHILKWMQFFPRENFLFLRTEELNLNQSSTLNRLTDFLGLDPLPEFKARLLLFKRKNMKMNFLNNSTFAMMPKTRLLLEAFYSPYNEKLATMLLDRRYV